MAARFKIDVSSYYIYHLYSFYPIYSFIAYIATDKISINSTFFSIIIITTVTRIANTILPVDRLVKDRETEIANTLEFK